MATIDISREHSLGIEPAKRIAEQIARQLAERAGAEWRWEGDAIMLNVPSGPTKGVRGSISVSASRVRVELDLPLLLRPFKSPFEAKIRRRLEEAFRTP